MSKDTVGRTFSVAAAVCVVCAIVVSTAAVSLRPMQAKNKLLDLKSNILASAGLLQEGVSVEEQFEQVRTRVVDMETGKFSDEVDAATYDQRKAAKDPDLSYALPPDEDPAKLMRRARYATVYIVEGDEGVDKVILPIKGYGLWSTLYGFLALESDLKTIAGIGFYEHGETPGLGGEIDNPRWKNIWVGKKAYESGEVVVNILKGTVDPSSPKANTQIDGLAGATLTTRGVDNLVRYWLGDEGFAPFIRHLKAGEA